MKPQLLTVSDTRYFEIGQRISVRKKTFRVHGIARKSNVLVIRPLPWYEHVWLYLKSHLRNFMCKVPRQ